MSPESSQQSRHRTRSPLGGVVVALLLLGAAPAGAQAPPPIPGGPEPGEGFRPRIVREGTVSLGGQAQYGTYFARTGFGRVYGAGPGMAVRLRYRTSRETALGISFEAQRMNADDDPVEDLDPEWLRTITTTLEYYQYFAVKKRTPRYLLAGAGLAQTRRRLNNGETDFPGDAGVLTLGGGTEIWWKRWFTIDLSLRYYMFARSRDGVWDLSHNVQAAAGVQFYTSK